MAKFSVEVPDDLIADAAAAWTRLMDRRAVDQRQDLKIDDAWATNCAINNLGNILISDQHETNTEAANAATQVHQLRVAALVKAVSDAGLPTP